MGVTLKEGRLYKSQFAQLGTWAGRLVDSALQPYKRTSLQTQREALLSGEVNFRQIDKYCCNKDKHRSSTVARFWTRITTCHCYFQVLLSWFKLYKPFFGGPTFIHCLTLGCHAMHWRCICIQQEIDSSTVHQELPKQMVTQRESWGKSSQDSLYSERKFSNKCFA